MKHHITYVHPQDVRKAIDGNDYLEAPLYKAEPTGEWARLTRLEIIKPTQLEAIEALYYKIFELSKTSPLTMLGNIQYGFIEKTNEYWAQAFIAQGEIING